MPGDVGRPITDIASDLLYSELANDSRKVLRTLVLHEQEVNTRDGSWFLMRIMPYRRLENMVDGCGHYFCEHHRFQDTGGKTTQDASRFVQTNQPTKPETGAAERKYQSLRSLNRSGLVTLAG
jgi:hypothetical protein